MVVACSGGPDSVAMTHVLARLALPIELIVAAVDHGLRPEAKDEVALVSELASSLELRFVPLRVEVAAGASVQAHARQARYAALRELAGSLGATRIAVGHTRDDQAETVLARILRGASIDGLAGIAPLRSDGVCRPLIDCARGDAHAYVVAQGLAWARDPSNDDRRYLRVRVRNALLPALQVEDARLNEHLAAIADDARATRRVIRRRAAAMLRHARVGSGLAIVALAGTDEPTRRATLARWARDATGRAVSRAHREALDRCVCDRRGEVWLAGDFVARIDEEVLVVGRRRR